MTNFAEAFLGAQDRAIQRRQVQEDRDKQSALGRLFGQAWNAPPDQRNGLMGLIAQNDPGAAMQMDGMFRQRGEMERRTLADEAAYAVNLSPEARANWFAGRRGAIAASNPALASLATWDWNEAEGLPVLQQLAASAGGRNQMAPKVLSPGAAMVSPDGRLIYQNPAASPAPRSQQFVQVPDGNGGFRSGIFDPGSGDVRMWDPQNGGGGNSAFSFTPAPGTEDDAAAMDFQSLAPDQQDVASQYLQRGEPFTIQGGRVMPGTGNSAPAAGGLGTTPPKGRDQVATLTPEEVAAAGFPPNSVVQRSGDGTLRAVRVPSERDANGGRALPATVVESLTKDAEKLTTLESLMGSFNPAFAGNVVGGSVENTLGRLGGERIGLTTEGQASWWQQYDRLRNVVRNELFGAALTATEAQAFEAADITPNMDPQTVTTNLAEQAAIIRRALERKSRVWESQGFNPQAVLEATSVGGRPAPAGTGPVARPIRVLRVRPAGQP
jgi:hypothetical protein